MCETLPYLCETKSRGAAASGLTDWCGETLCETLLIDLPICANTEGGTGGRECCQDLPIFDL